MASLAQPTASQPNTSAISPLVLIDRSHEIGDRVNANTRELSVSTSAQIRESASRTRSQSRRGGSVTTESTLRNSGARQAQRSHQTHSPVPVTKAGHQEGTTQSRRGVAVTWDFTHGLSARTGVTLLSRHEFCALLRFVSLIDNPLIRTSFRN